MNWVPKRATGPEYDILRLLPGRDQRRIWHSCSSRVYAKTHVVLLLHTLLLSAFALTTVIDALLAPRLGGGRVVRVVTDVLVFHVLLHPLFRRWWGYVLELAKPYLEAELDASLGTERYEFLLAAVSHGDESALNAVRAAGAGRR